MKLKGHIEKVYYAETTYGGPAGGHCGYQWVADIWVVMDLPEASHSQINGKKFKGIILNKENREPNESDMTNALNFSVARFKEWYKDEQDKAIKMKKQANKEYHFTDMARKLTIEDEIAEREK